MIENSVFTDLFLLLFFFFSFFLIICLRVFCLFFTKMNKLTEIKNQISNENES